MGYLKSSDSFEPKFKIYNKKVVSRCPYIHNENVKYVYHIIWIFKYFSMITLKHEVSLLIVLDNHLLR